ncbi:S9 family peptidase [Psychroflexus maritimus]|uniref:S9 family peptidase n=1 Tax=Psychroflexus maritimus TaxID=2714865 RepID=A0A967AE47_9FLAO|nr:S9 family peptidase [Psychroflexus maritimus]NGZ90602.1 S9 family peptidase [Psychroflexus maritimus]
MPKISTLIAFLFLVTTAAQAQEKKISLEEIWGGAFQTKGMQSLQSLNNGQEYIVQEYDRQKGEMKVVVYSYKTGKKVRTLFSSIDMRGLNFFQNFELSDDESKVILGTEIEAIFRRSTRGIFYAYDLEKKELQLIDDEPIQEPTFSPDATKVAYVKNNNIYVRNLSNNKKTQLTSDGKKNEIINGVTDWVYEEEFAFVRAFQWNSAGNQLAYLRFDETEVTEFSMDLFGSYGQFLYPQQEVFKYPKAGDDNAKVSLHCFDLEQNKSIDVDLGEYEYIPRIKWTNNANLLSVQTMNRHQNELHLQLVDVSKNSTSTIFKDTDEAYVEVTDYLTFLADNSFIWTSEKDGWNHIYHYSLDGQLKNQLTSGNWEVTKYYGYDKESKRIFYQSTESGSVNRGVYSIQLNGKGKQNLATEPGTNSASFSADFTYFINTFQNTITPPIYSLYLAKNAKLVRKIKDNQKLEKKLSRYALSPKEISQLEVNGEMLNMWMIKPTGFSEDKKYPVFMSQYSGPGSQSVANTFLGANDYWYQLLANQGYVVVCIDGRGTGYKGRDFKKVTQGELGKYELEDQAEAAKILGKYDWIDQDRIGIWGWSYGGFMASNAILQHPDVFSTAIAVAPVTSWRFYDTIYTERYMKTPQENAKGYDDNSPITHASQLDGNYLLIHGGGDDNVHVQNTMIMIEALVQANKQFDWRVYPDKNHGIYGGNTRLHLYTLMTNFILENL